MAVATVTVKKPSENSPLKRANRRRCERKQTPQNRVSATKGKSWEKTVEDSCLLPAQTAEHEARAIAPSLYVVQDRERPPLERDAVIPLRLSIVT